MNFEISSYPVENTVKARPMSAATHRARVRVIMLTRSVGEGEGPEPFARDADRVL